MQTLKNYPNHSVGQHRGLTLLELLVVTAVVAVTITGFVYLGERSMISAARNREFVKCLIAAENELEWRAAQPPALLADLPSGTQPFSNPTAASFDRLCESKLITKRTGEQALYLRSVVERSFGQQRIKAELETFLPLREAR